MASTCDQLSQCQSNSESEDDTVYSDQEEDSFEDDDGCSQGAVLDVNGRHRFFACYLLVSQSPHARSRNRTYIGFTVNPARRIRQHNGELKGAGARRTVFHRPWKMVAVVHGFACKIQALAFEWAWTNPHRTKTLQHLRTRTGKQKAFPRTPRGRIQTLFALCTARPWRTCPLALSVLIPKESWMETLTSSTKAADRPDLPTTLEVEFADLEKVADKCKERYDYRENLHSLPSPPPTDRYAGGCLVCHKNVDNSATQPRTQCYHCGRLACLTCFAVCVSTVDHSGAEDRLVPDRVFCLKCKKSMPWALVTRLSRALSADAATEYDLSGT